MPHDREDFVSGYLFNFQDDPPVVQQQDVPCGDIAGEILVVEPDAFLVAEFALGVENQQIAGFQDEMRAADADWVFVNFSKAVHCFSEPGADRPPGCAYDETAARRAYAYLDLFLKEKL